MAPQLYASLDPYPLPRTDRGQGIPTNSSAPGAVNVPRVFNWSGHLRNAGANLLGVITSRRVVGPAFVDTIEYIAQLGAGAGNSPKAIFGYSLSDIAEGSDLTDAALTQVNVFFEQDFRDDGGFTAAGPAGVYHTASAAGLVRDIRLKRAIQAPEFFLVAAVRDAGDATAYIVDFTMRVLENVEPDLLGELILG